MLINARFYRSAACERDREIEDPTEFVVLFIDFHCDNNVPATEVIDQSILTEKLKIIK